MVHGVTDANHLISDNATEVYHFILSKSIKCCHTVFYSWCEVIVFIEFVELSVICQDFRLNPD